MFWLFNKSDKYNFLQIFPYYKKYKDADAGCINLLYDFTANKEIPENINVEPITMTFSINIKDNYIQYKKDDTITTFIVEHEFIKETDELNNLKIPYFIWNYTITDNKKMPFMSQKNYDYHYNKVIFTIYKINDNKLFVIEQINDNIKKYILEKNN